MQNKSKKIFSIKKGYVIIVFVIAVILFFIFRPKTKKTNEDLPPITVTEETSNNQIPISGYILAARTQVLESPGEGLVEIVSVKEGQTVKEGDVIFKLDDSKQRYDLANQVFNMRQEEINASPRKMDLIKQQYDMLKKQLENRTVRAKFDGVVASLKVSEGKYALAKENFGTIVDRSFLKATVEVNEMDSSKLKVNQKVILNFPSQANLQVEGFVVSYPSIARVTEVGRTVVDTEIQINNPPSEILPGYSFDGNIIAGESEAILILQTEGLRYVDGKPVVDKIDPKTKATIETQVEVEPYMTGFVKIVSGLKAGDQVKNQGSVQQIY